MALEAATGFEPVNDGFADRSLNHLGTPPIFKERLGSTAAPIRQDSSKMLETGRRA